jgi:cbb3-type cytochrome c oxidase subunit III
MRRFTRAVAPLVVVTSVIAGMPSRADVPYSPESVEKGRALFMANCTPCHGNDGKSQVDVISNATDLTEPLLYRNGRTDADLDRSIRDGVGGVMPAWGPVLNSDESISNLRNFIKSLWPADQRGQ